MPIFSPYAGDRELSRLFMQLGQLSDSGVPISRTLDLLTQRSTGRAGQIARAMQAGVARGESLEEATEPVRHRLPPLAREMMVTGEEAGMLDRVCMQLSDHYEFRADLRRRVILGMAYPVFLLAFAIHVPFVVKFILGQGGLSYLLWMYTVVALALVGLAMLGQVRSLRSGLAEVCMGLPGIGWYLKTLAINNFTEAFRLMNDAGVGILDTLPRAGRASGNQAFARRVDRSIETVQRGQTISSALASTGLFPAEYLAVLETSEESGQLSIGLAKLSEQYRDKARGATTWISRVAVGVIYGGVVLYVAFTIISFFVMYVQEIYKTMEP